MDIMAIASASMQVSAANWQQSASIALLDKAMNVQEQQGQAIIDMIEPKPSFGHKLDIYI